MVVVTLVRMSGYQWPDLDLVWHLFWLYLEACIALIMASLKTFRTAFVTITHKKNEEKKRAKPSSFIHRRLMAKLNRHHSQVKGLEKTEEDGLPAIPRPTLTGMRTFIHRNNSRSVDEIPSEYDRLDEGHDFNEVEINSNHNRTSISVV